MVTEIPAIIASEASKFATKFLLEKLKKVFSSGVLLGSEHDVYTRISKHLTRVGNWASTYNFLGLGIPKDADKETIALRFNSTPRRYGAARSSGIREELSERDLLETSHSSILLGDPGAGKTTTLRRIALTLLMQDATSEADSYQFPLLLVLRELPKNRFMCEEIADVFGLPYEKLPRQPVWRESGRRGAQTLSRTDFDIKVHGSPIEDCLADLLNATRALIVIDGLDELEFVQRASVESEIEALNTRLTDGKMIVSCRSGDYNTNLHGFRLFEILPLSREEIATIANFWVEDPVAFLRSLQQAPYADIVDRPLLLSFLLYLFRSEGELPEQPSMVYRKVVYRLLKEWDEERRIKRTSRYSHFDPDRKIDFLSELAYYLTYEINGKVFTEKTFIEAYNHIHSSFNLPVHEYKQVASEIETHTGIVISTGLNSFEFAHLSIQEFLCANYISRSPYPDLLKKYLSEYPAPVAVACALSSNPSMFIVEMINRHLADKFRNPLDPLHGESQNQLSFDLFGANTASALKSFLSRLKAENPFFKPDKRFGESILCMFAFYYRRYWSDVDELLVEFATTPGAVNSLRMAFVNFSGFKPHKLTDKTAVFEMDSWFRAMYENVVGHWLRDEKRKRILPLVLFPTSMLEGLWSGKPTSTISADMRERINATISHTPFCLIENGDHTFKFKRSCSVCGFTSPPKF